jgi:hypothetical protein
MTEATTSDRDDLLEQVEALTRSRDRWRRAAWVFGGAFLLAAVTGVYVGEFYYTAAVEAKAHAAYSLGLRSYYPRSTPVIQTVSDQAEERPEKP